MKIIVEIQWEDDVPSETLYQVDELDLTPKKVAMALYDYFEYTKFYVREIRLTPLIPEAEPTLC